MDNTRLSATLLAVGAAGLLVGGTVGMLTGAADASHPSAAASKVQVLRFVERTDPKTNIDIDLGKSGFSVGDQQVFRDPIMRGDRQVGTVQGFGEITYLTKSQLGVTGVATADLGKGTLALRFSAVENLSTGPSARSVSAITGGTGDYAGATGQCVSNKIGDSEDAKISCRVVLPG